MNAPVRERLIEAADELFYTHGVRAVSADRIIERVGTTKVTFYRHFRTKDDLVVVYLERRAALERSGVEALTAQAGGDVDASLRLLSGAIGDLACGPGFRGCPFINAAAEYPDPDHPVRQVIDAHRSWWKAMYAQLVKPLALPHEAVVVDGLMMLRDGAMVAGNLGDAAATADAFLHSCRAVIARPGD